MLAPKRLLLGMFAIITLQVGSCAAPYPRGGLEKPYSNGSPPNFQFKQFGDRDIHYAEISAEEGTPLFFIHGSPGDWQAWSAYLDNPDLANFGPRLAVDRPGFGASRDGGIVTDLRQQARLLSDLLPQDRSSIVVAHSLGSPIAAWMAIDNPSLVCGVISIAGSLAPELEGMRWYNEIASWKVFQGLIPAGLIDSNREIQALQDELRLLDHAWLQLQRPIVVLQGLQDELVKPATANYMEEVVNNALLTVQRFPEQGHFLLWESPRLVTQAIVDMNASHCRPTITK